MYVIRLWIAHCESSDNNWDQQEEKNVYNKEIIIFDFMPFFQTFLHEASDVKSSRWPARKLNKKSAVICSVNYLLKLFQVEWTLSSQLLLTYS